MVGEHLGQLLASVVDPIGTIAGGRASPTIAVAATRLAASRARARSILFTKISVGMRSRCSARISSGVCACTPSTAETTSTAPSSTLSTRSTSAMKSGWPGVSIRLTRDVVDRERHDGGLDRDAALPLERQGVGLGGAVVDAADLVDDAGGVEQPLGESRLTGVYMRQDSQVERSFAASVIPSE